MNTFTQMAAEWIRQNYVQNAPAPELPADDLAAWRVPFQAWLKSDCVVKDRCFGGIGCLHVHFAEWAITHDAVPCTRDTFERLLSDAGYLYADGFVSSLILAEDWEAAFWKPQTPNAITAQSGPKRVKA
jgi:hypothetical protein